MKKGDKRAEKKDFDMEFLIAKAIGDFRELKKQDDKKCEEKAEVVYK